MHMRVCTAPRGLDTGTQSNTLFIYTPPEHDRYWNKNEKWKHEEK